MAETEFSKFSKLSPDLSLAYRQLAEPSLAQDAGVPYTHLGTKGYESVMK